MGQGLGVGPAAATPCGNDRAARCFLWGLGSCDLDGNIRSHNLKTGQEAVGCRRPNRQAPRAGRELTHVPRAEHHHIVPRSYLLRFATEDGELSMFDKKMGDWMDTHASNAAVRSDFYTVDLINEGASDEVEKALGSIEGRMITALTHIDEGVWPPDEEDRRAIADFVGLQSVRGADFGDSIQDFYDRVGQKMADLIAATGAGVRKAFAEEHGRAPTVKKFEEQKRSIAGMQVRAEIPRNYHVTVMLEMAGEQALIVYAKQLHVLRASEDVHFVTADVPLALWAETPGPFGAISVMMADELSIPIGRDRCLLLNHPVAEGNRGEETFQEVDSARVDEINRRIVNQAARFIFCHPDDRSNVQRLIEQ